jgi:quinol-cytochrome oxidoreductase complex cytochrome b subunit
MFPNKLTLSIFVRVLLCLLVSAVCYFMFTALLGATRQASQTRILWAMTILTSGVVWAFALVRPAFALMGLLTDAVRTLGCADPIAART